MAGKATDMELARKIASMAIKEPGVFAVDSKPKIEFKPTKHISNCGTFVIIQEPVALGGLLDTQLLRDPRVLVAGHFMPDPYSPTLNLKVRYMDVDIE